MAFVTGRMHWARQGLPLRGHHEDINSLDGNLYKLLLRAEDCPQLKSWVYRKEYTSPDIINEIIAIMGNTVLREILGLLELVCGFPSLRTRLPTFLEMNRCHYPFDGLMVVTKYMRSPLV